MPSETRILLLRHAETAAPDRFHGAESDVGLGERGRGQAEEVARRLAPLRPGAVASSAMRRAVETAGPIARACGLGIEIVEPLHERKMGSLSGQAKDDGWANYVETMERWKAGDLDHAHDGAESFAAIRDRVVPAFVGLADRHPGRTIVVVAHGIVIRVLLTTLLDGFGPRDFDRIPIDFVAVNDLRRERDRWRGAGLPLSWPV